MSTINEPETGEILLNMTESLVETITQPDEELNAFAQITTVETYEAVVETIENNLEEQNPPILPSKSDKMLAILNTEEINSNDSLGHSILTRLVSVLDGYICVAGKANLNNIVSKLNRPNVEFYELDTKNKESLSRFATHVRQTYGGVNILINNYNLSDVNNSVSDIIEFNFRAIVNLFNELFPLLRTNARIVNISSRRGLLRRCYDRRLRNKISNIEKLEDLNSVIDDYIKATEENTVDDGGYPDTAFDMSKLATNVLTKIQQKNFDDTNSAVQGIISNSICPGQTESKIIELALLPSDYSGIKGCLYIEDDQVNWETGYLLVQNTN